MIYDAFISYSHAADGKLAPALQRALEKYAKPWYRRRALHIFRDETNLSASPHLWQSIIDHLSQAEWLILMASPDAARSKWVKREVQWWLEHRVSSRILILLTEGNVNWNEEVRDFDWERTTAIPQVLQGKFSDEPLHVDLRWAKSENNLTLRHTEFRSAVLRVAATVHGLAMDEMDGQAVRAYKKNIASAAVLVTALVAALAATIWQWRAATLAEAEAAKQAKVAQSRELAARADSLLKDDPQLALNLAVRGALRWQTVEAVMAVGRALALVEPGTREPIGHVGGPGDRFVTLSATARYGVTLRRDGRLAVWQLRPESRQVLGDTVLAGIPLFSQDETLIATRTSEGVLTVWRIEDGQQVARSENVQTASFSGEGLAYLRVGRPDMGLLELWNPKTHGAKSVPVYAPHGVHGVVFLPGFDGTFYVTVDDRNIDAWNFFAAAANSADIRRDRPQARYTEAQGIAEAWFSSSGLFVVITNANGSTIVRTMNATLQSPVSLRSLRTVAFSHGGQFMVAVPESGRAAVVDMNTGGILSALPEESQNVTAAAFGADDQTIVLASPDGQIYQHRCIACLPFERALGIAKSALARPLTLAEREAYLHEQRPRPCPSIIGAVEIRNCLELAPDSGPPGTLVEVSLLVPQAKIGLSLTDATGKTWQLPMIEAAPGIYPAYGSAQRVGTLTIPEGVALGPATVRADGAIRTFSVICIWCDL